MKKRFDNIRRSLTNFSQVRQHIHYDGELLHKPFGDTAEPLPREFELLVWNVFKGGCGEAFKRDIRKYAKSANVLCLQEVLFEKGPQLPYSLDHLAYDYSPSYSRLDAAHEGVMTLSRHALHPVGQRLRSVGSEPLVSTPKSSVISSVPLAGGGELTILNTHMLLVRSQRSARQELQAALDMLDSIARSAPADPALFVGDFNTLLPQQLTLVDDELRQHGFSRAEPASDPRRMRLDHVYSRNVESCEVTIDHGLDSSDHPALVCKITV